MGLARSTCWPASTRACAGSASTTSTSSTRTASTPTRPSRRRWAPSPRPCTRARPSTSASRRTRPSAPRGGRHPARPRREAADPPAVVLDAQPVDRGPASSTRCEADGVGCIAFSPLAQGLLTSRYLGGVPEGSRAQPGGSLAPIDAVATRHLAKVRALERRSRPAGPVAGPAGHGLDLRDPRITSALDRGEQRRPAGGEPGRRAPPRLQRPSELAEIDGATPSTPASTSGPGPAPADAENLIRLIAGSRVRGRRLVALWRFDPKKWTTKTQQAVAAALEQAQANANPELRPTTCWPPCSARTTRSSCPCSRSSAWRR